MAKTGRPKVEIDKKQFETLCGSQCTLAEIASYFDVTEKTVIAWCKRTYKDTFYSVSEQKKGKGKMQVEQIIKLSKKVPLCQSCQDANNVINAATSLSVKKIVEIEFKKGKYYFSLL